MYLVRENIVVEYGIRNWFLNLQDVLCAFW